MLREIARAAAIFLVGALWLSGHRWIDAQVDFTPNAVRSPIAYAVPGPERLAFEPVAAGPCTMDSDELDAQRRQRRGRDVLIAGWLKLAVAFADRGDITPAMNLCRQVLKIDRHEPLARRMLSDLRAEGRLGDGFRAGRVQTWLSAQDSREPLGD